MGNFLSLLKLSSGPDGSPFIISIESVFSMLSKNITLNFQNSRLDNQITEQFANIPIAHHEV